MKKSLFLLLSVCSTLISIAQKPDALIDALHYQFKVRLSDQSDKIEGQAIVRFRVLQPTSSIRLNLVKTAADGKGMTVTEVRDGKTLAFNQDSSDLIIRFPDNLPSGTEKEITILYSGIPRDGLIIGQNKYGRRGFFADHWPERARNWLPCVDHPADKATLTFIIIAPDHYQVVANGKRTEESNLTDGYRQTRYDETVPLATKIMVIGVADFAVQEAGMVGCVPVQSWVYAEDRENGFHDYADALDILPFFNERIAPFAYPKLANVQSKTRYGGLENAGAIFYFENSVTGKGKLPSLLSHEIAHQWFGDMASEKEWAHVWLSEGFATYMSDLYMEHRFGHDTLISNLKKQRKEVIEFSRTNSRPIVDSAAIDPMILLNANSYQKAGWVLHMMHEQLGDSMFWTVVRNYYKSYAGGNASTEDFQKIVETTTGRDWSAYFRQWFYTPGQPDLEFRLLKSNRAGEQTLEITQKQSHLFQCALELGIDQPGGATEVRNVDIRERSTRVQVPAGVKSAGLHPDPGTRLMASFNMLPQ